MIVLRYLFAFLLLSHGLIHLLGFVSQWHLATVSQMTGRSLVPVPESMSKPLGVLWLLVCLGFLVAMVGYLLRRDNWLPVALVSLLLSQVLIILYWPDARAGTVANIGIAVVLGLTYAHNRFAQQIDLEARQLLDQPAIAQDIITRDMLTGLPLPVQKWLIGSGVVGKERVHTVRLRQRGQLRTSPDGQWMPVEAEQYFGVDAPGFVWKVDTRMLSFLPIAGRDKYADGTGSMLIKVLSLVAVADGSGPKTGQGAMLRFLGETCWFPSAALSPYITWQPIDATHAQATMTYKKVSAAAVFAFDPQYRLLSVSANRYMGEGPESKLEKWFIPVRAWKTMHGVTIPVKGDVIWQLPAGDFNYFQWEVTDIDYNKPVLY